MRKRWLEELKKEKRIAEIRRELEKQGKHTTATEILLTMLRQVGQATAIITQVQEYLELPPKAKFRDIVSNEKLRSGIDGCDRSGISSRYYQENRNGSSQIEQQLMTFR